MPKKSKAVEVNDYVYIAPKCEIHESTQTCEINDLEDVQEFQVVKKPRGRPTKKSEPNIMLIKEAITKKDIEDLYGYVMHDVELSKKLKNKIELITQ